MPEVPETVSERQFQKGGLHAAGSGLGLKPHPRLVSACSWSRGLEGSRNSPSVQLEFHLPLGVTPVPTRLGPWYQEKTSTLSQRLPTNMREKAHSQPQPPSSPTLPLSFPLPSSLAPATTRITLGIYYLRQVSHFPRQRHSCVARSGLGSWGWGLGWGSPGPFDSTQFSGHKGF